LNVVRPAGIESGASNLYSDAVMLTTFADAGAAVVPVVVAAAVESAVFDASFVVQAPTAITIAAAGTKRRLLLILVLLGELTNGNSNFEMRHNARQGDKFSSRLTDR